MMHILIETTENFWFPFPFPLCTMVGEKYFHLLTIKKKCAESFPEDRITSYSFLKSQVLGYSFTVNISKTLQAERSGDLRFLEKDSWYPWKFIFQGWSAGWWDSVIQELSFSMWLLREDNPSVYYNLSLCMDSINSFYHSGI